MHVQQRQLACLVVSSERLCLCSLNRDTSLREASVTNAVLGVLLRHSRVKYYGELGDSAGSCGL